MQVHLGSRMTLFPICYCDVLCYKYAYLPGSMSLTYSLVLLLEVGGPLG